MARIRRKISNALEITHLGVFTKDYKKTFFEILILIAIVDIILYAAHIIPFYLSFYGMIGLFITGTIARTFYNFSQQSPLGMLLNIVGMMLGVLVVLDLDLQIASMFGYQEQQVTLSLAFVDVPASLLNSTLFPLLLLVFGASMALVYFGRKLVAMIIIIMTVGVTFWLLLGELVPPEQMFTVAYGANAVVAEIVAILKLVALNLVGMYLVFLRKEMG
ncbi:hypothetical protein [Candidatus Borrarchaeum sp.]|uniref:hypothetical protein n=1 Tax=Candidatus Borrarchaeum sp. TaxID=2846742 RepID=UPI002579C48A|nr:hypothetical protein [Candidatus Borrarchaeum sp.]